MADKVALITGITGQDGAYLADFLLARDYIVHGIKRRASSLNTQRIDHLYRREAYGLHASNGILFNHESPLRGETFVTRKITRAVAAIEAGRQQRLYLGNLDARRDWGHARDYVEGMWLMLQQDQPDDYVLSTGEAHSVRAFAELAFARIGRPIVWRGTGVEETGCCARSGEVLIAIDPTYRRPTEADHLVGDPTKARQRLGWWHRTRFEDLVAEMVDADRAAARSTSSPSFAGEEHELVITVA
ncbi:GDP-mannose 4,6-dehydratase [Reyranella sp. CPCC 100927]|uniref:GDP-mannose 4,6-dehydratase n=1 Tax=Reyranella sp. CPCC 100927 TaxID=2599616 RepID=UPI0011B68B45|nr:GDP-mannose 4,6-dehydratase [Reyranella sp. CPCC 100927]TWS95118.1 GDP-mannose 4,6-dehydratase [Reyranella sp. CPCC 100927]